MTDLPWTAEQQTTRAAADAAYRMRLAASRLNRANWPADLLAAVETAEARMAGKDPQKMTTGL